MTGLHLLTERNAKHGNLARGLSTEFLSETSQGASPIMTKKMFFEHSLTMNEVLFYSAGYAEAHVVGEGSWGVSDSAHNTTR